MNGNKSHRMNKARSTRTIRVAPITSAIRAALATSATLLALAGSGVAFAGTCVPTAANTMSCNGDFTQTVPGSIFAPAVDLTLILGDTLPTSVTPAAGQMGVNAAWGGNVGVISYADITTVGADGVHVYGSTSASVGNYGDITTKVTGRAQQALDVIAYGDVTVVNGGDILAYSNGATSVTAVFAKSNHGNVSIDNQATGTITASAYYGFYGGAIGVNAIAYDSVDVNNDGAISAITMDGDYFSRTFGVRAMANHGDSTVTNAGSITTEGSKSVGIYADSTSGTASVTNTGTITMTGTGGGTGGGHYGFGISVKANAGADANIVDNAGSITVTTDGFATNATGIDAGDRRAAEYFKYGGHGGTTYTTVTNSGDIAVTSGSTGDRLGIAAGIRAYAKYGDVTVVNSGDIAATGVGSGGAALGIEAYTKYGGISIVNSGDITATSVDPVDATRAASAKGIKAMSLKYGNGGISIDNSGNISASSAHAYGITAYAAYDGDVVVTNSGNIAAHSFGAPLAPGSYESADGISAVAQAGDATVTNSGSIIADSSAGSGGRARGIVAASVRGGNFIVDNSGNITVTGPTAMGVYAVSTGGTGVAHLTNSGDITVSASEFAAGAYVVSYYTDSEVINSGAITATSSDSTYAGTAIGVVTINGYGDSSIVNSGSIIASTDSNYSGEAYGIYSYSLYGGVNVTNTGTIAASVVSSDAKYGAATAMGVSLNSTGYTGGFGDILVTNSSTGSITASAQAGTGAALATGISVAAYIGSLYYGNGVTVDNAGAVSALAGTGDYAAFGSATALGVSALGGREGFADVSNAGTISAAATTGTGASYASAVAAGIVAQSQYGNISISSTGNLNVTATTGDGSFGNQADALGLYASSYDGTISVDNGGAITATAGSGTGSLYSYTTAAGITALISAGGYGALDIANSGSIRATAQDYATGILALSYGASGFGGVNVSNLGAIAATASGGDYAAAVGVMASGYDVLVGQGGTVSAAADGSYTAQAIGVWAEGVYSGYFTSAAGSVLTATASAPTSALAQGVVVTGSDVSVSLAGTINATALADAGSGVATANGLMVQGSTTAVILDPGSAINAMATGYDGSAIGLSVLGDSDVAASNAGLIGAQFIGTYGDAYGAIIASATGSVTFTNTGSITATDADYAVGVELDSTTYTTLTNTGTITANAAAAGSIAVRTGASADLIQNTGTINGAIVTGDGDDTLNNAVSGIWNAVGTSDFGAGDDTINNAGTIHLDNATITLGSYSVSGNQFGNTGLITVSGDNLIDMGALNPNAFTNTGIIDFRDGAPDDMLTIMGDFGGDGTINLDVSGLHGTSDLLYIDGNVVDGSVNTINVALLDLPIIRGFKTDIPVVYVTGDSTAASFALGAVAFNQDASFLNLVFNYNLIADIDASNVTNDVFSLGVTVKGLSQRGELAASIAPGVQSMMTSQTGTWRQRVGVAGEYPRSGVSLWTRQDKGTSNSTQMGSNFGQDGNFGYDQQNSSTESGVDFAVSDQFSLGMLLARAEANQRLNEAGVGTGASRINGNTYGVYGTWVSPGGFYLDASWRRMSFEANLYSVSGMMGANGDAETFNLEMGYAWTLGGGLKVEPQFQYTRTGVDNIDKLSGVLADFQPEGGNSSRGRLGVMLHQTFGASGGGTVWMPYAAVSAVREFDGRNAYAINDDLFGETSTAGTSALIEGGLSVHTGNLSVYGNLNWQDGGALNSFVGGQLGLRYAW